MTDLVLLSGGLDSATALASSARHARLGGAVAFNYGQRHRRELDAAQAVADWYGTHLDVLDVRGWGALLTGSGLTDVDRTLDGTGTSAVVPNRNAALLSMAAGLALSHAHDTVVTATHADDHAEFSDCRPEFLAAIDQVIRLASEDAVRVVAPFAQISKRDVARLAVELGVPIGLTWSCYRGGEQPCEQCAACAGRRDALSALGVSA